MLGCNFLVEVNSEAGTAGKFSKAFFQLNRASVEEMSDRLESLFGLDRLGGDDAEIDVRQLCGVGGRFGGRGLAGRGDTGPIGCRVTITGFGL